MKHLNEPLLHFAVAGLVLFSAYSWVNPKSSEAQKMAPVQIGQGEVDWLRQLFQNQWLRPPDARELQGLITDLVDEELLAREAQAMGLGEDDGIIRRRLAQKLKFLVEDTTRLADPEDGVLRTYFEANVARFAEAPSISFSQVYFNAESRRDAAADAAAAISLLNAGAKEDEVGDRFLLGSQMARADRQAVSNMFGDEFADKVLEIEPGKWSGPIKSGYGMHVVLVTGREASDPPAFDMVRDRVLAEWRRDNEKKVARDYLARLRERYGVELDEHVKSLLEPRPQVDVSLQ